jgi:hypothetical protein
VDGSIRDGAIQKKNRSRIARFRCHPNQMAAARRRIRRNLNWWLRRHRHFRRKNWTSRLTLRHRLRNQKTLNSIRRHLRLWCGE